MRKIILIVLAVAAVVLTALAVAKINEDNSYKVLYREEIGQACEEFSVPEDLIFAVIKCESDFNPDAKSPAGAVGLMQLMPATFDEVAWRLKESPDASAISDPAFSVRYGVYYLSYLIRYFGNEETAIAAYNAGMGRVNSWLSDSRYSDDGVTLKNIPYKETKDYVNKVLTARKKYKSILGGKTE